MTFDRRALLAWSFGAPLALVATPELAQAAGPKRDFYRGQCAATIDLAAASSGRFNDATAGYTGTDEQNLDIIAEVRSWAGMRELVQTFKPSAGDETVQSDLEASFAHLAKAAERIESAINGGGADDLDAATAELKASTDVLIDVEAALDLPLHKP